ncbi:MEDS domain-containing protein [Occallatibacter savannae]|uniref:MEDS domain-containing protein n=1 Tax=Occallatibacter savannae TaxID=1002691 RepID=UPI000D6856A2|nr:MEDS domain-containing protein [Occallatibacter savannae]
MGPHDSRHQCLIYEGAPSRHIPAVASALGEKLRSNHRCLYLNSRPMIAGLKSQLAAYGIDVEHAISSGNLVLSAEQNHLLGEWEFDVPSMMATLERSLQQALSDGYQGLWATGDMTWEFGPAKDLTKLLEYEWRLEDFMRRHPEMSGICQYHADTLPRDILHKGLRSHRHLFISETLTILNPHYSERSSPAHGAAHELDGFLTSVLNPESLN